MSLLAEAMTPCVYMNKAVVNDGEGGRITTWTEGAQIIAAIRFDNSTEARIASSLGTTNLYTIITQRDVSLEYHEVIKRLSDGKIFRVTSDGEDNKTPASAMLNMREVSAEEWRLAT